MSIAPPCHTRTTKTTDDWITPKWLVDRIGPFDLDPCASDTQPWQHAHMNWKRSDGHGLSTSWGDNFVFLNPVYGRAMTPWMEKMARHNNGIALIFARTETKCFFDHVWPHASALLFIRKRLTFHYPDGSLPRMGHNSGGPSVLIEYGPTARNRLIACRDLGALVEVTHPRGAQ